MANIFPILLSLFILQTSSKADPSDDSAISKISEEGPKLDSVPDQTIIENESENNQRQKRFYDYGGFGYSQPGFPTFVPYNPVQTNYFKRDQSQNTGVYGAEDGISLIYRRLLEIVSNIRRYPQSIPQQSTIPTFIPFVYIPQVGCGCTTSSSTDTNTSEVPSKPVNSNGQPQPSPDTNVPDLPTRISETDEKPPTWGIASNNIQPAPKADVERDGNRPISFDPIIPQTPLDVPVPPVEHGSVQAGAQPQPIPTTTFTPITRRPMVNGPTTIRRSQSSSRIPAIAPTITCDTAILSCCLQPQVNPNCFAQRGCPDTSIYGKPCDPEVVLNVVKKVKHYVEQRNS